MRLRPSRYPRFLLVSALAAVGLGSNGCDQQDAQRVQAGLQIASVVASASGQAAGNARYRPVAYGNTRRGGSTYRPPSSIGSTRSWRDVLGLPGGGSRGGGGGGGLPLSEGGTVPQHLQGQAFRVKASTFGNQTTAKRSADNPDNYLSRGERCVALPADAIGRWVVVSAGGNQVYAPVCDKGPWRTNDPYWETGQRPWAERNVGKKMCGGLDNGESSCNIRVNGAAIDLSWQTWADLVGGSEAGAKNSGGMVEWAFADRAQGLAWVQSRSTGNTMMAWFPTRPEQLRTARA